MSGRKKSSAERGEKPAQVRDAAAESQADREALPLVRRWAADWGSRGFPLVWRLGSKEERLPAVGWFDPAQLISTGWKSLVSFVVGVRSDRRIVQALAARDRQFYDYTVHYRDTDTGPQPVADRPRDELWLDFVCDTGDGWNATYAVAHAVAQPELTVVAGDRERVLPRGEVLVFGGDEVYPTPSREAYLRRLVCPFEAAFGTARPESRPHVFAVPGNHDWYDGLSAFTRLFCSDVGGRRFAGWWSRQSRSYFALKLPHRWWLLGSDGQLQSDLDVPQIEYFREIAEKHMQPGDRVILCLAEPVWIYAHKYRRHGRFFDETDLIYLREEIFGRRGVEVSVYLTGDLHHYRRHEERVPAEDGDRSPIQKIVSGGGGAFLHPTHDEDVTVLTEDSVDPEAPAREFRLAASYPEPRRSRRLTYGNLWFGFRNPRFGLVPALLYLLTAWWVGSAVGFAVPVDLGSALSLTGDALIASPGLVLWVLAIAGGLVAFTDTHSRPYRWVGGLGHAALHGAAIFLLGWSASRLGAFLGTAPGAWSPSWVFLLQSVLVFSGGWILGSMIVGWYLLISLNVFGRHSEQAFSSLRIEDFKQFLRLQVSRDGKLTIYPIKIERVPRSWRGRTADDRTPSEVVPAEPFAPALIEPPIVIGGGRPIAEGRTTRVARESRQGPKKGERRGRGG